MNRKLHLLVAALGLFIGSSVNAQTTIFEEDFNGTILGWTTTDTDGDGTAWMPYSMATHSRPGIASGQVMMLSFSFDNNSGPLTPDNYLFSPVIDLSAYSGKNVKIRWKAAAIDEDYSAENYSVYVSDTNTVASMLASSTSLTSISLSGVVDLTVNEMDISAFAGQSAVYVAFRHHNVTDEYAMAIDDFEVLEGTVSADEFFKTNFMMYPNPTSEVLNITSINGLNANEIRIMDVTGKVVKVQKDVSSINVSDLAEGTYLIDITTNEGKATSKFIKK